MTQEEKAKAYDEAIERAKAMIKVAANQDEAIGFTNTIFPELKESEDERIRKALLNEFIHLQSKGYKFAGLEGEDIIAWLEKQGEKNIADKAESKFHEGDWVILTVGELSTTLQIVNVDTNKKLYWFNDSSYLPIVDEECLRLWFIQDAKDGDVLYCKGENGIEYFVMNKGINEHDNIDSYFRYNSLNDFGVDIPSVLSSKNDNITPATKSQRDFLFQKMKEAGYEWDADKKELKKADKTKELSNYIKFLKSFHCWNKKQREIMDKYLEEEEKNTNKKKLKKIDNRFDYENANIQQKDFAPKASFANRQVYNRAILKLLSDYIENYPDIRFGQMLYNLGVNPHFDEESREAYWNLCKTINKRKS